MADEVDLDEVDGSTLRKMYEAALKELNTIRPENAKFKAREVISAKGFTLVKPEDLEGVALDKIEEHAEKLHTERRQLQADLAKDLFEQQGYEGDELTERVEEFMAGKVPAREPDDAAARRFEGVRALDREHSSPVGSEEPSKLHGLDAIKHGLAVAAKKNPPRAF